MSTIRKRRLTERISGLGLSARAWVRIPISVYKATKSNELVLILYGGTKDFNHRKTAGMKRAFAKAGFTAASFDFRGITQETDFKRTGLHTRIEDAREVLARLKREYPSHNITIFGVSMGGYIATFLAQDPAVKRLILSAPAAYHPDAVRKRICFGDEFSALIRTPGSWLNSDAFANISACDKDILLITFGKDEVVPKEITERYFDVAGDRPIDRKWLVTHMRFDEYGHKGNWDGKKLKDIMRIAIQWLKENDL